ncbi:MAG: hypothetical protein JRI25_20675 [Deltaproteobacteria bacterium]|nr:hypothetical protein [Deltaproteobacteria bacterium]
MLVRFRLPLSLLAVAVVSVALFVAAHRLGWRADTAFLAGNAVAEGAVLHGSLYALAWFQMVIAAPIFAVAALFCGLWEWVVGRRPDKSMDATTTG